MRLRDNVLTGLGVGLAGGFVTGVALDGGMGALIYACAGGLLGALTGAYLVVVARWPFWTAAALLGGAPLCLLLGALFDLPALMDLPTLLALPMAVSLLRDREARERLVSNALTLAVAVYAAVTLLAYLAHPAWATLAGALETLTPALAFVIGMTLHTRSQGAAATGAPASPREDESLASLSDGTPAWPRYTTLLGWVVGASGLLLALAIDASALSGGGSAPAHGLFADRPALANTLALIVIVALCADTERSYWRALLGRPARWQRLALGVGGCLALVAFIGAFTRIESRGALVALGGALAAIALLRRRLTSFALLAILTLAALALSGGRWLNPRLDTLGVALASDSWRHALTAATSAPFGQVAPIGTGAAVSPQTLYFATLWATGLPGLMALVAALGVTLALCRRAYRARRPNVAETGSVLVAGGCALYLLLGGLTSDPLSAAPVAFMFWLLLGRANASIVLAAERDAAGQAASGQSNRQRDYPLRVVYMTAGADAGEAPPALLEGFRAMDRRQLTPLLVAYGDGPLPRIAPDVDVVTRVVPIHDATALDLAATLAASPVGLLRRLGATRFGGWLCVRCDALGTLAASAREWRLLAQATLEARPDLVVSASPATHLPALVAGRLAGAPVLWHARDIAPARLQRLHDLLVGWTDGVLAPSQTAARAYHPLLVRRYGGRVRVLRPGIALPAPLVEDQRNELRRALGVPNAYPLLVAAGPLTPASGHRALLEAITRLRGHYPDLHVVVAREGLCDSSASLAQRGEALGVRQPTLTEQVGERWLDEAVAEAGLDAHVTALGARTDVAALLGVADVAIFPAAGAAMSRPLLLALALGTPIVAARSGALAEQLAEAWGFEFSEPEDAQSLAHAVESVVERLRRYRTDAKRNPGLVRDWGSARLEQARLLAVYREARMPARRSWTLWPRENAANLPSRWLAALWAGVGTEEEPETEREDLSAVAASVPVGVHAWVSMGA